MLGLDPGPYTLRELNWMAAGRLRNAWDHTATLQAQIINVMRSEKQAPVHPDALNPFREDPGRVRTGHPLDVETLGNVRSMLRKRNAGYR